MHRHWKINNYVIPHEIANFCFKLYLFYLTFKLAISNNVLFSDYSKEFIYNFEENMESLSIQEFSSFYTCKNLGWVIIDLAGWWILYQHFFDYLMLKFTFYA